jgi:hypothetical protein
MLRCGRLGFCSRDYKIFLFSTLSAQTLGPALSPIQWVPGGSFLGIKPLGREAHHSPPTNADFKKGGAVLPLPHTPSGWIIVTLL